MKSSPLRYANNLKKRRLNEDQLGRPLLDPCQFKSGKMHKLLESGKKKKLLDGDAHRYMFKPAILRVSPCVVAVVSLGLPLKMTRYSAFGFENDYLTGDQVFIGGGTIIECDKNAHDDNFSTTILTSASLFIRTDKIKPEDIEVEVYLAEKGAKCKGKVLACDFHYNLALVTVQMKSQVRPAKFRDLDDIMSIQLPESESFQLRPHSTLFKIRPGDQVAALVRFPTPRRTVVSFGQFSPHYPAFECKELYSIASKDPAFQDICGSPVINRHGEVIGVIAASASKNFLPSNVVSRWLNYYKNFKKYCRPWLGLNVTNLLSAKVKYLESILRAFPNVSSGVIVTKVIENSPAYNSGLRMEDVIVQCNGDPVGSILDLFDKIWNKVGEQVEFSLLRKKVRLNVKVTIDEAGLDNFYRWPVPYWAPKPGVDSSPHRDSDSE